tara:strand:- start:3049 stop:3324 length:276 start_codon:yes stop_codon:yes gene_type:complete
MDEMSSDEIKAYLEEVNPDALICDGLDSALVGVVRKPCQGEVAMYDEDRCIRLLMSDFNMTYSEAVDHFEFNIVGSYVGPHTPVFRIAVVG